MSKRHPTIREELLEFLEYRKGSAYLEEIVQSVQKKRQGESEDDIQRALFNAHDDYYVDIDGTTGIVTLSPMHKWTGAEFLIIALMASGGAYPTDKGFIMGPNISLISKDGMKVTSGFIFVVATKDLPPNESIAIDKPLVEMSPVPLLESIAIQGKEWEIEGRYPIIKLTTPQHNVHGISFETIDFRKI